MNAYDAHIQFLVNGYKTIKENGRDVAISVLAYGPKWPPNYLPKYPPKKKEADERNQITLAGDSAGGALIVALLLHANANPKHHYPFIPPFALPQGQNFKQALLISPTLPILVSFLPQGMVAEKPNKDVLTPEVLDTIWGGITAFVEKGVELPNLWIAPFLVGAEGNWWGALPVGKVAVLISGDELLRGALKKYHKGPVEIRLLEGEIHNQPLVDLAMGAEADKESTKFLRAWVQQLVNHCSGGDRASPPREAVRLHTIAPTPAQEEPRRPQSSKPQSRHGERTSSSRQGDRAASRHGDRPPSSRRADRPSSSKQRPSTSGSSRRDDRPSSSSRARPSSSREHSTKHRDGSKIRGRFDTIPENAVQYTEDQTIIDTTAELYTLIDQHAENFYFHDDYNSGRNAELNDPRTRHAIIRQRIARMIIDDIIMARRNNSEADLRNIAANLSAEFRDYAFATSGTQREEHLFELCNIGAELRGQMSSHPSTWEFGAWDEIRGPRSGYIMVFPTLLKDEEQAAARLQQEVLLHRVGPFVVDTCLCANQFFVAKYHLNVVRLAVKIEWRPIDALTCGVVWSLAMPHSPEVLRAFYLIALTKGDEPSSEGGGASISDALSRSEQGPETLRDRQDGHLKENQNQISESFGRGISLLRPILKAPLPYGKENPCQQCQLHGLYCDQQRPCCGKCQRYSILCYYEQDQDRSSEPQDHQPTDLHISSGVENMSWEQSVKFNPYQNLEGNGKRRRISNRSHGLKPGRLSKARRQRYLNGAEANESMKMEEERLLGSSVSPYPELDIEIPPRTPSQNSFSSLSKRSISRPNSSCSSKHLESMTLSSSNRTKSWWHGSSTIKTTPPTTGDSIASPHPQTVNSLDLAPRPFQCTFCLAQCKDQNDWEFHELSEHIPDSLWICMPWGPVEEIDGRDFCVFCGLEDPEEVHDSVHAIQACYFNGRAEHMFINEDDFIKHLSVVHHQVEMTPAMENWSRSCKVSDWYWNCGFCDEVLPTWAARVDHIGDHFKEGMVMSSWDPLSPAYPLDRTTLARPSWFPPLPWNAQTLWDLERERIGFSWIEEPHVCQQCEDKVSFRDKAAMNRHKSIWHSRREVWSCPTIEDIRAGILAPHFFPDHAEGYPSEDDCCYCKKPFNDQAQPDSFSDFDTWDIRYEHLDVYHDFDSCSLSWKSTRPGDLLLHLANIHKVSLTEMTFDVLESCRKEERPLARMIASSMQAPS
ncbi:hypothetical protein G7Y89_g5965 [Cudoniella acicularis]|uniref:Zn(2)-C6 fungal-type domain-containing protein n=1 Tax=Cudoniella acicularis TaxID=354080 RepID=A0A8H4RLF0_9HELO|nr:hypothetical protein G7Y89_g5965 [Cudoniella acicularis]